MAPVGDPDVLWVHAIGLRWPEADIESAATAIREMRMIKDSSEVAALRLAGRASAAAFRAGLQAIGPDVSQRTAEGAVIARCLSAGGDGIAFWPWVMSGANGIFPTPFTSFGDYRHLNRRMQSGELVRVDIGCEADYYQGDVGRTAPVSGVFSAGQREAWNLLVAAYQAGLAVIKDGVAWSDVEAAARAEVSSISDDPDRAPTTDLGKQAAALLMSDDGVEWHQHGIGLWASEPAVSVLRAGMVIAFEPMMAVDGQGYYLEDMLLITATGYEVLTPGLPYTAAEIEAVMSEE
jgi:Xaa-Pro aminopeptidase